MGTAHFRNDYNGLSSLAHTSIEPIYITKNGESDLVVMSIEAFLQQEELIRLRAKLEAAEQVRLSGAPTYSPAQVFDEVEAIYCGEEV